MIVALSSSLDEKGFIVGVGVGIIDGLLLSKTVGAVDGMEVAVGKKEWFVLGEWLILGIVGKREGNALDETIWELDGMDVVGKVEGYVEG